MEIFEKLLNSKTFKIKNLKKIYKSYIRKKTKDREKQMKQYNFMPEGWDNTISTLDGANIQEIINNQTTLQGIVANCDNNYNLHIDLGTYKGIMPISYFCISSGDRSHVLSDKIFIIAILRFI
jgi:hypothetical protein